MMDRPIRLRHDGRIESYDFASNTWILDKSRDPRELIPLTMPPETPAAMPFTKVATVNRMVYQLKNAVAHLVDWAGAETEPELYRVGTAVYGISDIANRAGIITSELQTNATYANDFYLPLSYAIAYQFYRYSGYADFFTSAAWEWLLCKFWCAVNDEMSFDYDTYWSLVDDIYENASVEFGDGAETIRLLLIFFGRKGLTNLGYLPFHTTTIEDPAMDCTCP